MTARVFNIRFLLIFLFTTLVSPAVYAQREKSPSEEIQTDTCHVPEQEGVKKKNLFVKAYDLLINYLDHYSYDTAYIRPPAFKYTVMLQHSASYENYTIRTSTPRPQKLKFAPDHSYKLGAYFGWHSLFLGFSINTDELFTNRRGSDKKTEYFINMYGCQLGCDLFYRSTGNDFKIRQSEGFYQDGVERDFSGTDYSGLKVKTIGANVYYVFNNKHFSYPAAYSQTTVQKISRGTLVAGISWSRHDCEFDHTSLPDGIKNDMSEGLKFTNVKYTDFNINFGYAFNWVFADNWLLAVALTPAVAYKVSDIKVQSSDYNQRHRNFNLDFITRAGLVYNDNRFFAGASAVAHVYQYYQKNFSLTDNFGVLNLYVGLNFGKKD